MDILIVGLMVCDIIANPVDAGIFKADSQVLKSLSLASGGDALNVAVVAAKLGSCVKLMGKVGRDPLGDFLLQEAAAAGVDVSTVVRAETATSASIALVEPSAERHFAYYGETNDSLSLSDLDMEALKQARIVHVGSAMQLKGLDGAPMVRLFKEAHAQGALTSMDVTGGSLIKLETIDEVLQCTDIFLPSIYEARQLSGLEGLEEICAFFSKYPIKVLGIKMGDKGCFLTDFKEQVYVDAYRDIPVVDTTGAGDSFVAGFLTAYLKGWSLKDCGVFASAVGANCVMEVGATKGAKEYGEILMFMKQHNYK